MTKTPHEIIVVSEAKQKLDNDIKKQAKDGSMYHRLVVNAEYDFYLQAIVYINGGSMPYVDVSKHFSLE